MKAYRLLADDDDRFVVHDGSHQFPVAKRGLSEATIIKIRQLAQGGEVQKFDEGGVEELLPAAEVVELPAPEPADYGPPEAPRDYVGEAVGSSPELDPAAQAAIEQSQVEIPYRGPSDLIGEPPPPGLGAAPPYEPPVLYQRTPEQGREYREAILSGQPTPDQIPAPALPSAGPVQGPPLPYNPTPGGAFPYAPPPSPTQQFPRLPVRPRAPAAPVAPPDNPLADLKAAEDRQFDLTKRQGDELAEYQRILLGQQEEQNRLNKDLVETFQRRMQQWEQRSNEMFENSRNSRVDPDHYWADKGAVSKVGSVIAILLSGIGQGLQNARGGNAPNLALAVLDKLIDNDIEAQRFNILSEHTLLREHMQMGLNLVQAEAAVRAELKDVFAGEMLASAYRYGATKEAITTAEILGQQLRQAGALARVKLASEATDIQEKVAQIKHLQAVTASTYQEMNQRRQLFDQQQARFTQTLMAYAQGKATQADVLRLQYPSEQVVEIPNSGGRAVVAAGKEAAPKVREMFATASSVKSSLGALLSLADKPLKSVNLADRGQAKIIAKGVVGTLRIAYTGPGAFSAGELKLMDDIVTDPTRLWSLDVVNKAKLRALIDDVDRKTLAIVQAYTEGGGALPSITPLR